MSSKSTCRGRARGCWSETLIFFAWTPVLKDGNDDKSLSWGLLTSHRIQCGLKCTWENVAQGHFRYRVKFTQFQPGVDVNFHPGLPRSSPALIILSRSPINKLPWIKAGFLASWYFVGPPRSLKGDRNQGRGDCHLPGKRYQCPLWHHNGDIFLNCVLSTSFWKSRGKNKRITFWLFPGS